MRKENLLVIFQYLPNHFHKVKVKNMQIIKTCQFYSLILKMALKKRKM